MTSPNADRETRERESSRTGSADQNSQEQTSKLADSASTEDASAFSSEEDIDAALDMTFPASDPPAWMGGGADQ